MTRVPKIFKDCVDDLKLNENIPDKKDMVVFHTLRHTFASWLAIEGVPLYTIQILMGHKTIEMTQRYAHLCPDHKRKAINILADVFIDIK